MAKQLSEKDEHVEYVFHRIQAIRDSFEKIDGRIRVVKLAGHFEVENAERYQYYPQVTRLKRELDDLNRFMESHSDEEIPDLLYERYEI